MEASLEIDYAQAAEEYDLDATKWATFCRDVLTPVWLRAYRVMTPWAPQVLEVSHDKLVYLFDAAPTFARAARADDRVVAVWGTSVAPVVARDRRRLAGFVPDPARWSGQRRDRGHLVAHTAGGGLDINLIPQAAALNRGRGTDGMRWRALERIAASRPGTPLFVRPTYDDNGWTPATLDYGLFFDGALRTERFANATGPRPARQPRPQKNEEARSADLPEA